MKPRASFELEGYSHGNNPIPAAARIGNLVMTGGISGIDLATRKMPTSLELSGLHVPRASDF